MFAQHLHAAKLRLWLVVVLSLAGCASLGDTFRVTPFLREQITGDTWRACLAREYQTETRQALRDGRAWIRASSMAAKGWTALEQGDVAPAIYDGPDAGVRSYLEPRRSALVEALKAKAGGPCACAKAQATFDAWAELAGRNDHFVQGQAEFDEALAACQAAPSPAR